MFWVFQGPFQAYQPFQGFLHFSGVLGVAGHPESIFSSEYHFFSFASGFFTYQLPEVIQGQNCVPLSDAALDDSYFSKFCFIKSNVNML